MGRGADDLWNGQSCLEWIRPFCWWKQRRRGVWKMSLCLHCSVIGWFGEHNSRCWSIALLGMMISYPPILHEAIVASSLIWLDESEDDPARQSQINAPTNLQLSVSPYPNSQSSMTRTDCYYPRNNVVIFFPFHSFNLTLAFGAMLRCTAGTLAVWVNTLESKLLNYANCKRTTRGRKR